MLIDILDPSTTKEIIPVVSTDLQASIPDSHDVEATTALGQMIAQHDRHQILLIETAKTSNWPQLHQLRHFCEQSTLRERLEKPDFRSKIGSIIQNYRDSRYFSVFLQRRGRRVPRGVLSAHLDALEQMDSVPSGYYSHGMNFSRI